MPKVSVSVPYGVEDVPYLIVLLLGPEHRKEEPRRPVLDRGQEGPLVGSLEEDLLLDGAVLLLPVPDVAEGHRPAQDLGYLVGVLEDPEAPGGELPEGNVDPHVDPHPHVLDGAVPLGGLVLNGLLGPLLHDKPVCDGEVILKVGQKLDLMRTRLPPLYGLLVAVVIGTVHPSNGTRTRRHR